MASFTYRAKNQNNQISEGNIEAATEGSAVDALQSRGLLVLNLDPAKEGLLKQDIFAAFAKTNRKDLVIFTRQLSTLITADIPLVEGLRILTKQVEKAAFKKVVSDIVAAVEGGANLSTAFQSHPEIFNKFYVSLVRSGEVSGKLDTTLLYLAEYLEGSAALSSKIRGALAYPVFVLFAMVVVSIIMVTTVLPNLLSVLKEAGIQDLPFTTKILIAVTDFVNSNIIVLGLALIGFLYWVFSYSRTKNGRERWDRVKIDVPGFGTIVRNLYIARFAETLSTLIKSGVPILQGMEITSEVVGNVIFKRIIMEARENVKSGGTISDTLAKYEEFPPLVPSMLVVGERTGRTDFMLDNILRFYKSESEAAIQNISQLIEPALILVLGFGVAVLVASILLPIYSLVGAN